MRHLPMLFFTIATICSVSAQSTDTNYALPSNAMEISNNVSNTPGFMLSLQEGGTVPSDSKSTCDGKTDGTYKSSVGFTLQHYYDKEQLKQMNDAYTSMGGMKAYYLKTIQSGYDSTEPGLYQGPVLKKGKLEVSESQEAVVSYYTITYGCIQNSNPTATKTVYNVMLLTDNDYLQIANEIYSANVEIAKKYADEIIAKIKALDFEKVN